MRRMQNIKKKATLTRNFVSFIWYHFWNQNSNYLVKKWENNLAIFGPFSDLQEFFEIEG